MPRVEHTATRPQTPSRAEIFLDHVGWFVADAEAAASHFARLGFVLTPFVAHRAADDAGRSRLTGTGNQCAMLELGYLELLSTVGGAETPLAGQHRAALKRHAGVHLLAFSVADAHAWHTRLAAAGFQPLDPVLLERPVHGDAVASFTVIRVPPQAMPEGRIQLLVHHTPAVAWQPRLTAHQNGLAELAGALICTPDVARVAARYARFLGRTPLPSKSAVVFRLDRGTLVVADPQICARALGESRLPAPPVIAAISFRSHDVPATAAFLELRGVALERCASGHLLIAAKDALGAALVIHDAATSLLSLLDRP